MEGSEQISDFIKYNDAELQDIKGESPEMYSALSNVLAALSKKYGARSTTKKTPTDKLLATDAYMFDAYGEKLWRSVTKFLFSEGFSEAGVIEILRSKHMRWADDSVGQISTLKEFKEYYGDGSGIRDFVREYVGASGFADGNQFPKSDNDGLYFGITFNEFKVAILTFGLKSFAREKYFKSNGLSGSEVATARKGLMEKGWMNKNTSLSANGKQKLNELKSATNMPIQINTPHGFDQQAHLWGVSNTPPKKKSTVKVKKKPVSKPKGRANRPSPSIKAGSVPEGTLEVGNDGNMYISQSDKNGVQRWKKFKGDDSPVSDLQQEEKDLVQALAWIDKSDPEYTDLINELERVRKKLKS